MRAYWKCTVTGALTHEDYDEFCSDGPTKWAAEKAKSIFVQARFGVFLVCSIGVLQYTVTGRVVAREQIDDLPDEIKLYKLLLGES